MKKIWIVAVAAAVASPAFAADTGSTVISGTLLQSSSVTEPAAQTIDPASTAVQNVGTVSYQCNFVGNSTLKLWSLNGGRIISPASATNGNIQQVHTYSTTFDNTNLSLLPTTVGAATAVTRAMAAAGVAQSGLMQIQLSTGATVAGTYTDTISVSIAP